MMEIKFIPKEFIKNMRPIRSYCFGIPTDGLSFFEENVYSMENALGCFDGDSLAGIMYIHPFDIFLKGLSIPMGGIGMVATLPEYRNRHCAHDMLIRALEIMRDRGQIFSALAPFNYPFYRRYGWELGFVDKVYNIPIMELKGLGTGEVAFRTLSSKDIEQMARVNEKYFSQYNGATKRDECRWKLKLKEIERDGSHVYGFGYNNDDLKGYIIYTLNENTLSIREIAYGSFESRLELLRFVYSHSTQVNKVTWRAPKDDNTLLLLPNPESVEQREAVGMMMRVVDVKKALEFLPYPESIKNTFTLRVGDKWAPWNHGAFEIHVENGRALVENLGDQLGEGKNEDIVSDITALSQVIFGYIGIKEAIELGRLTLNDPEKLGELDIIFSKHSTYMTDRF